MDRLPRCVVWSAVFYRALIRAYPASFRRACGDEMVLVFRELATDAWNRRRWIGLIGAWFCILADLSRSIPQQYWLVISRPDFSGITTPPTLKSFRSWIVSNCTGVHDAIVICLLASIACGVGWVQARRECNRSHDLNQHLTSEIAALQESVAASQQKMDDSTKLTQALITELEERRADLLAVETKRAAELQEKLSRRRGPAFSFVGMIDLDGDGNDDRDLLREIVATAGCIIDNDVKQNGDLYVHGKLEFKPDVTPKTKFVVIGTIPLVTAAGDLQERKAIETICDRSQELQSQARARGVRVISLGDFLKYVGYKSDRRPELPDNNAYQLKSGTSSAAQPYFEDRSNGRDDHSNESALLSDMRTDNPFRRELRSQSKVFRGPRHADGAISFEKLPDQ